MKRVLVFGTFDHLHPGHLDFFSQAKKLGDYLFVAVARDKNVEKAKGSLPKYNENQRLEAVQKESVVDEAQLASMNMDYLTTIRETEADIIALGYDQRFDENQLLTELQTSGLGQVTVVRLKPFRPDKYKSSLLKNG
jgi:FAD synthetase